VNKASKGIDNSAVDPKALKVGHDKTGAEAVKDKSNGKSNGHVNGNGHPDVNGHSDVNGADSLSEKKGKI
jgi:hypothetical protein